LVTHRYGGLGIVGLRNRCDCPAINACHVDNRGRANHQCRINICGIADHRRGKYDWGCTAPECRDYERINHGCIHHGCANRFNHHLGECTGATETEDLSESNQRT
jgi:hypothetical protein